MHTQQENVHVLESREYRKIVGGNFGFLVISAYYIVKSSRSFENFFTKSMF